MGALDLKRPDALLLLDARRSRHLPRGDIGFLERARAFDLKLAGGKLRVDTLGRERFFARDAGCLGGLCGADLLLVDRAVTGDFAAADFLLKRDAFVGDDAFLRNPRPLGRLTRSDLGLLQFVSAFDLEPAV